MSNEITTTVMAGDKKCIGTYCYGDVDWIDHCGALLVTCDDDPDNPWLEVVQPLQAYNSSMDPIWEVYRIGLDPDYFDWADLPAVASCCGLDLGELKTGLQDPDPINRVGAICAIGEYYGFGELDPYHLTLNVPEVRERYPDEDPDFNCEHEPNVESAILDKDENGDLVIVLVCKKCDGKGEFVPDLNDCDWE